MVFDGKADPIVLFMTTMIPKHITPTFFRYIELAMHTRGKQSLHIPLTNYMDSWGPLAPKKLSSSQTAQRSRVRHLAIA